LLRELHRFLGGLSGRGFGAVLWNGGSGFGGVLAFILADLIVLPILSIYNTASITD
jgi:uncharacterized protein